MEKLKSALHFGGILTKEEIETIFIYFTIKDLQAGKEFLAYGKVSNEIGFVDKGIIRAYSINEKGEEATVYFFRENQFVVDLESYYSRKPSNTPLQAVTNSRIICINCTEWGKLNETIPRLFLLTKSLAEATLINKIKDNDFLNFGTAIDKYKEFMKR